MEVKKRYKQNDNNRERPIQLKFRVTEEEYERIIRRAKNSHSRSEYIRNMALKGKVTIPVPTIDRQSLLEMNKIGVNLNQVVKKINESDVNIFSRAIRISLLREIEPLIKLLKEKINFVDDKILGE